MQSSVIGDEEFDFDDEIVNSRAYRRIINRHRPPNDSSPSDGGVQGDVQEDEEYPEREPGERVAREGLRHTAGTSQRHDGAGWDTPRRKRNAARYPVPQLSDTSCPEDGESELSAISRILLATELALELDSASSDSDSSWVAPLRTRTREPPAWPLEYHDPENLDQSHDSSAILLSERNVTTDLAVRRLLRHVEDWKSHKPENFGNLLIWGKYNIDSRFSQGKVHHPRPAFYDQIILD